jgi:hypothetical protein
MTCLAAAARPGKALRFALPRALLYIKRAIS